MPMPRTPHKPRKGKKGTTVQEDKTSTTSDVAVRDSTMGYDWTVLFNGITCPTHSVASNGYAKARDNALTWERNNGALNIYYVSDTSNPAPWLVRVAAGVYCNTSRILVPEPDDSFVGLTNNRLTVLNGVLYCGDKKADISDHFGAVLVSANKAYIVVEVAAGGVLSRIDFELPGPPYLGETSCSFCVGESLFDSSESDVDRNPIEHVPSRVKQVANPGEPGTSQEVSDNSIYPVPTPDYRGEFSRQEWEDYWGTRYYKYSCDNLSYLVCRDVSLIARHVPEGTGMREIYPDLCTGHQTIALATSSLSNPCLYVDGQCFRLFGWQHFLLLRNDKIIVIKAQVIRSSERLTSGLCVYYWTSGWHPYSASNVRACSIITIGRKIGEYYYYAVMNGSTHFYELKLAIANVLKKVEYRRDRNIENISEAVLSVEEQSFKNNRLYRLLSKTGKVVASWTDDSVFEYEPWKYEYFARTIGELTVNIGGAPMALEAKIREAGGLNHLLRQIEDNLSTMFDVGGGCAVIRTCTICFMETKYLHINSIIVRLVESNSPSLRLIGGEFLLRASSASLSVVISQVSNTLWAAGFQAITWTGNLSILESLNGEELSDIFSGCELAITPIILFCSDDTRSLESIRDKLIEANAGLERAIARVTDVTLHSDWKLGAAKMRQPTVSNKTIASLREWRLQRAIQPEELIFNTSQACADAMSPEEICDIGPGDWWAGEVVSALDAGSCFGAGGNLVSSHHVTYGNPVTITRAGLTYTWEDIFHSSADEDIVIYGKQNHKFATADEGEVVCAICPSRGIGKFLIIERVRQDQPSRGQALFYELRPIDVDPDFNHIVASNWRGVQGMSGSPIINSQGKIISIYGLGKIESRAIRTYDRVTQTGAVEALTVLAPDSSSDASPIHYFRSAVLELLSSRLSGEEQYYLVEAPTGSGKTMSFTSQLLENLSGARRVYLLQPTVAAVRGAYTHLVHLLASEGENKHKYTLGFVVGQQHADHMDISGSGPVKLTIMSYGTALRRANEIINDADFVLLDEIHCRSDPTVVAGDLQFTVKGARYKCVHLTATVLTREGARQLAQGLEISGTRFPIIETERMIPLCKDDTDVSDWWVIPKSVIGTRLEGFRLGYKVPLKPILSGRTVFFLASRNDCEKLQAHAKRTLPVGVETAVVHGGTTFNIESLPEKVICFCTDVVGQAVTIPGCTTVVDFLEEVKPDTRLEFSGSGLMYSHKLVRRTIGKSTSLQRKGRTGRTHAGSYITPLGIEPTRDYEVDRRTAAVALLELEASKRLKWELIDNHHNSRLVQELRDLRWILPQQLALSDWWRKLHASLQRDGRMKLSEGKTQVCINLRPKLDLLRDVNGDILYLYLTPVISDENCLLRRTNEAYYRTSSLESDNEWHKRFFDFCYLIATEEQRDEALADYSTSISSFLERPGKELELNMQLLAEIGIANASEDPGEYVFHNALNMLGGTAVAVGATAVILSAVYNLTVKNLGRFVTRVFPFRANFAAGQAKYVAQHYSSDPNPCAGNLIAGRALQAVMQRKDCLFDYLKKVGLISDTVSHGLPTMAAVMTGAESLLNTCIAAAPATLGVGLFPGLASIMTSAWIGSNFASLERVLGRALSVSVFAILNGMCYYFASLPLAITSCVAQVVGFVVRGMCSGATVDYDVYGRPIGSSDRAWDLVFGIGSGVGIAFLIKNQLFLTAQAATSGLLAQTAQTSLGVTQGTSGLFGATGNALIFVKQAYLIFTRVQDGNLPWNSMGAAITLAMQSLSMDITTSVLGIIISISLIAVRAGLRAAKFHAGISCKSTRAVEGTNTYVEEYFGSFDHFALSVLSAGSCLASPSSIISIVIAWIGNCCRRGDVTRQNFQDAFEAYSGVPIAVAILSEGLVALGSSEGFRRDSFDIFTVALGVPSFIAGVFGCVYWAKNPTVVHAISDVWQNVKAFFSFAWKFASNCVVKTLSSIGCHLGGGIISGVVECLPKWCQPKIRDTVLEEKFSLIRAEPAVVNEWYHSRVKAGRVSIIERLHYSRPISRLDHYGSIPPLSFVEFNRDVGQGMSICRKYVSDVPFEFFCITAEDLGAIVSCFANSVNVDGPTLKLDRGDCSVLIEMAYSASAATHFVRVIKGYFSISFLLISIKNDKGSTIYVVGYRTPGGILDMLFSKLACLHPGIEAVSGPYENVTPESMMLETNHLCKWSDVGVNFSWQRAITSACLSAVDKAAGVFGLVNKVDENKFDLGLIPEQWCARPDNLSTEEWELYQWLLWSHYESGTMITSLVDPLNRRNDLPSRLLDCCTHLWRNVDDSGRLDSHSETMERYVGNYIRFTRNSDASDPSFRRHGTGFDGEFDLTCGLDASDSWARTAWWTGLNVYYSVNDTLCLSTLGGYCSCSVLILISNRVVVGFVRCPTHKNSWKIQVNSESSMDGGVTTDASELTTRLNSVLDHWYNENLWRKGLGKATGEVIGRDTVNTRTWLQSIKKLWANDNFVNHSESILSDIISGINRMYEMMLKVDKPAKRAIGLLEDWNASVVTSEISAKRVALDINLSNIPKPELVEEPISESERLKFLLGYSKPNIGVAHGWKPLGRSVKDDGTWYADVASTIKAGRDVEKFASRLTRNNWLKMERLGRVELPRRSDDGGAYVSRGGFKMQQLHEADPMFFEDVNTILDPCCGFGGFAEYYSQAMASKKPKLYLMSSLFEKGHRVPVGEIRQTEHSNVTVSLLTNPDSEDRGNIKDSRCLARLISQAKHLGGHDLLILDAGEYSSDGNKNRNFWLSKSGKMESFLSAVLTLIDATNENGKACIKINGVWHGVEQAVHELSKRFAKVKAIKLGTAPLSSPEWYLLCSGFGSKDHDMRRSSFLVSSVCEEQRYHYLLMQQIIRVRGRGWKTVKRGDWFQPGRRATMVQTVLRADNRSPGLVLNISTPVGELHSEWDPAWDARLEKFNQVVRNRKMKFIPEIASPFENICGAGTIIKRRKSQQPKNTKNGLISEFMGRVWGLTDLNSTVCHTQSTDKWKESSRKKRLDVNPGQMDSGALSKIFEATRLLISSYGKSLKGTCRLLSKQEVEQMVNNQGSTGALDEGHNLGEFMLLRPNWYEESMKLISHWQEGKPTAGYFTCRPKNEPKKKKCVEDGKLIVSGPEELEEYNEQGHRFIQFADAQTRLAHYVLFGDMLHKSGKQKLYKGTINGTPPMYMGRVIRAMWDMNAEKCNREIREGGDVDSQVKYKILNGDKLGGKGDPTAICLDYSGWDTTVTTGERVVEADFCSFFYPKELRSAIMNCLMETACPITLDDDGTVWLRAGQRGSGEILTSFGNTALVAANTAVAIAACTGLSVAEVCETVAIIEYAVGLKNGQLVTKTVEVTRFCQMSDGDDTFIVTTREWAIAIMNNIEEVLTLQRKAIRSGGKGGAKLCDKFEEIDFCSHSYLKVRINNANWWLQTRPVSDILSKMRMTLKINTSRWDKNNKDCVDITRSKILSYLILYPHIRSVRYSCMSLLAVTGDGSLNRGEFVRRWEWAQDLTNMTAIKALNSVYGVQSIEEIGYVTYKHEFSDLLTLKKNTSITGNLTKINLREYTMYMFKAILILGIADSNVIAWDTTYAKLFCSYLVTGKRSESEIYSHINNNNKLKTIHDKIIGIIQGGKGHSNYYAAVSRALEEEKVRVDLSGA